MATEALKTAPITALDALPPIFPVTGEGGAGHLKSINAHVVTTAGVTSGSTYRMVRIPTNAKVKRVFLTNAAQGATGNVDIDIAFSDSPGESQQFQQFAGGIVQISGVDNKLFGSAVTITAAQKNQDQTFANTFTTDHMNLPLWQVLVNLGTTQFSTDPGGYFDVLLKTTSTLANGGDISIEVQFVVN
jgi:hypothetical protein